MIFPSKSVDEASNIVRQISRLTVTFGHKFQMGTANDRVVLTAAINILTQAMIIATTDPAIAQRLYTSALKIGSLAGKNIK